MSSNISIKTQDFFNNISSPQIEEKLSFLTKVLPRKCTRNNYQLTKRLLKIPHSVHEDNLQETLQNIADKMREHLLIKRYIKILIIPTIEAGKFEQIGDLNCIYINGALHNQNLQQKVAILAHEMSHYYLIYKQKIYLNDTNENELLTEVNTIYTGLGLFLLEGYKVFKKTEYNMTHTSKVGYIDIQTTKIIIARTAQLRKQNPIWILKNVGIDNIPYFIIKLFTLIKTYCATKIKRYQAQSKLKS